MKNMEKKVPLLKVENLSVNFYTRDGVTRAVQDLNYEVAAGETLAIVGESGSGKSVSSYSLLGLIPQPPGKVESGRAYFYGKGVEGVDLLSCSAKQLQKIRGNRISMIFQDPMTSLNPYLTIGTQLIEPLVYHRNVSKPQARERAAEILLEVGIDNSERRLKQYPHEFSGGMRQRVMIAMALITEPELLIADEPTTALDVTIQAQIFELINGLQKKYNIGIIFITHDLAAVAEMADRVLVMKRGVVVEQGTTEEIFNNTKHDYTRALLSAIPSTAKPEEHRFIADESSSKILKVDKLNTIYYEKSTKLLGSTFTKVKAVDGVSLHLMSGEILGLVGESGCGKSTLSKTVMRLVEEESGSIQLDGLEMTSLSAEALKNTRKDLQIIFQDPYASLNPRMSVYELLREPLRLHKIVPREQIDQHIAELMTEVGLSPADIRKYPHEFSGGQRQRIAIARALAVKPKMIIADEPVSALDVTIQAQILSLLLELVEKHRLSMIFVSHDLAVVRYLCDRTAVMYKGRLVEENDTEELFNHPQHAYTQKLLSAIPVLDPGRRRRANDGTGK